MHIKKKEFGSEIKWYDITDKELYMNRRRFLKTAGKFAVAGAASPQTRNLTNTRM
jgi:hypothetical protein